MSNQNLHLCLILLWQNQSNPNHRTQKRYEGSDHQPALPESNG
jgi:hypothetical protein